MATVLVTGGTGLIGKNLCKLLQNKGYKVFILSRNKNNTNKNSFYWNIDSEYIEPDAIKNADYIIHLAGTNISEKRWTKKQKDLLINSRVKTANLLFKNVQKFNPNLKGFIAASGIGYYGTITSDKIFNENDKAGADFLSKVCVLWENSSQQFNSLNIKTVIFRTGVVLSEKGGALAKISKPVKMGFGSPIGSGNQYMPWIHINDLCEMYVNAIEKIEMKGIYNAVAPEHITNKNLTKTIAKKLNKRIWLPNTPSFVLKLLFGEMASILLEGSRASSEKITDTGFKFEFKTLNDALNNLLN
ncbi:TIGR01777 family oxidoreductase [Lutibacter sp. B1]|uniref:TIGR01777 family oxidoreductase n=1 Tax=Lutibacter sp. B1 TaxID=2725996 RepID=UPI001456F8C7|nr:TIGR01777 family oxidoreductase [Lutibacter sp. B1]NLP57562.1 TIGR01777 family protein [Lutibacter sp. B1]